MKIAIVGVAAEGKSHFADHVLFAALVKPENLYYGFTFYDRDGSLTAHRAGSPTVVVREFNYTQMDEMVDWVRRP